MATRRIFIVSSLTLALGLCGLQGCAVESAYVGPSLAYVEPGVYVVVDHDYPVFFYDNYYWSLRGGIWYRSLYYDRAWVRSRRVPPRVRGIRRPSRYRRYHSRGRVYRPRDIPRARRDRDRRARRPRRGRR